MSDPTPGNPSYLLVFLLLLSTPILLLKWFCSVLQDTLQFWDLQRGVKGEPRQVFLFDHQILIALPVNAEGFYDFQTGIKVFCISVLEIE